MFNTKQCKIKDSNKFRFLQTEEDIQYIAKARGGTMDPTELPDLAHIFERALSYELAEDREDEPEEEEKKEIEIDGSFEDEDGEEIDQAGSDEEDETNQNAAEGVEEDEEVEEEESMDDAAEASMSGDEDDPEED